MYEFIQLKSDRAITTSFHVVQNGKPVAVLSDCLGTPSRVSDIHSWALFRLADGSEVPGFDKAMTLEQAKLATCAINIEPEVAYSTCYLMVDTAYGFTLFFSVAFNKDDELVTEPDECTTMSLEDGLSLLKNENRLLKLRPLISGDWLVKAELVAFENGQTIATECLGQSEIRYEHQN